MPRQIGSQYRETLEESGYQIHRRLDDETVILFHNTTPELGEYYVMRDDHSGAVIEINGKGYEFCRSFPLTESDFL